MAKLYLKFEQAVLKEVPLSQGLITIGRLPDNLLQIDNLAVSGHHAKIYFEDGHFVIEDNNSLNGTYVNSRRVTKAVLNDDDQVLIGKHTIMFKEEADQPAQKTRPDHAMPVVPKLEATVAIDTKQIKEMMARGATGVDGGAAAAAPAKERTGMLVVMDGKTDHPQYVLSSKLSVIGKSDMASIKLKGWFAPKVAAVINHRDNRYYIAASEKDVKVLVNNTVVTGQHQLQEGDIVEVAGVKMNFSFTE